MLVQLPGEGSDELAMREMFRVLRPGGVAFARAAAYEWMRSGHDEALGTQRLEPVRGAHSLLIRHGPTSPQTPARSRCRAARSAADPSGKSR